MKELLQFIPRPTATSDRWQGCSLPPQYQSLKAQEGTAWFVDGGNASILEAPHFSLQKLRAVAVRMPFKEVRKKEAFCLITKNHEGWELRSDNGLVAGMVFGELGDAITQARQQLEHAVAKECDDLVVLDGDVAPLGCVALQKSCTVLTENGFPLSSILTAPGPWYAQLNALYAVKLHERARHVFLVHGATKEQLAVLSGYSADSVFPGYPYGLVLADRLARVSNDEAASLRIHARALLKDAQLVANAQAAIDSHGILDSL
jgi:hypothetical protein